MNQESTRQSTPIASDTAQSEGNQQRQQRLARSLEIVSVILMSVAALLAAWSAYQGTTWATTMSIKFAQASTRRVLATRAATLAGQMTMIDVDLFANWLNAYAADNTALASFYEQRFRPEFQPAFDAWIAMKPRTNPDAPKSPFAMPEYVVGKAEEANKLDSEAEGFYNEALAANDTRDRYAETTVLLASVLFFVGMAQRMKWFPLQVVMVAIGAVLMLFSLYRLVILTIG